MVSALDRVGLSESQAIAITGHTRPLSTRAAARQNEHANAAKDTPFRGEHDDSERRRATARGRMPRSLEEALEWFAGAVVLETPEAIHRGPDTVWAEHTKKVQVRTNRATGMAEVWHADCGVEACKTPHLQPGVGGSLIGSPDETGGFRAWFYGSSSATDEDGFYLYPLRRALDELERRGHAFMKLNLLAVAAAGFDWRGVADHKAWSQEEYADYLTYALRQAWMLTFDRDERKARVA